MKLRKATLDDLHFLWELRNHPQVRQAFFHADVIDLQTHRQWLEDKLNCENTLLFIAELDGTRLGQARLDLDTTQTQAEIHVSVLPNHHGQGFGSRILREACQWAFTESPADRVLAHIKPENIASLRSFEKAGFQKNGPVVLKGHPCTEMILQKPEFTPGAL